MSYYFENIEKEATFVKEIDVKEHNIIARLYTDVKTDTLVQYEHYLDVFEKQSDEKLATITSEISTFGSQENGDSHVLGMFKDGRHLNHGFSNTYKDIKQFEQAALRLIETLL